MAVALSYVTSIFCMVLGGALLTGGLSALRVLTHLGWPEFAMQSAGYTLSTACTAIYLYFSGIGFPVVPREGKWILGSGLSMALSMVLLIVSVWLGAPLGDISALVSINVVLAALLGRLFLGESLRCVHFFSSLGSFAGALLISRPAVIFGNDSSASIDDDTGNGYAWLAYALAPVAGFLDACMLICARKCPNASEWHIAFAYYGIASVALPVTAAILLESDTEGYQPYLKVAEYPYQSLGWLIALVALELPQMALFVMGAKRLPAAVSATVDVTSRIVFGYVAQVLFFGGTMAPLTMLGAGLMLGSVVIMAAVREKMPTSSQTPSHVKSGNGVEEATPPEEAVAPDGELESDSENIMVPSFVSFVASEFVDVEPRTQYLQRFARELRKRLRRPKAAQVELASLGSRQPSAQIIGAS
eukprot:TRINITY_DN17191_c3_g1_i1.p1 TRINITY_DN17191_c3_g1~~TRINITY_DN17191_c3_g1_i1.p1  ORF type:complete len:417 (-),score=55.12 TRINITY_DN17191_c3_g1_i1:120-1370(-)